MSDVISAVFEILCMQTVGRTVSNKFSILWLVQCIAPYAFVFLFTKKWSRTFLTRDLFCKQSILPKNLKTAKMSFVYKTKPQISKNMTIIWHLFVRIQYNIGDHSYNSKIWIVKEHWGLKKNFTRRFFLVVVYFYSKIYKNFWEGQAYCQRYVFYQKWKKLLTATHNTSNINDFVLFLFF